MFSSTLMYLITAWILLKITIKDDTKLCDHVCVSLIKCIKLKILKSSTLQDDKSNLLLFFSL